LKPQRLHNADEIMVEIVVERAVERFKRAGSVVMKGVGATALGIGF